MTSEERRKGRYRRRKAMREIRRLRRSLACGNFEEVFSFRHIYLSGKKCTKGVLWKNSTQRFIGNIIPISAKIKKELTNGGSTHKGFHEFYIIERGKKRHIKSIHISERTAQKCLCNFVLTPVYSSSFIYDNGASLKGKGIDFAIKRATKHLRQHYRKHGTKGGILVFDFKGYFENIKHKLLFYESARRIHDTKIRVLNDNFIKDFGRVGLGLGSEASQIQALMFLNPFDHFIKEELRISGYGRYMDDGYLIHDDIEYLKECLKKMKAFCNILGIEFNDKKTMIVPIEKGFRFLKIKFILNCNGKVILRMNKKANTTMKHKLKSFKEWHNEGNMALSDIRNSYNSYKGHMKRGNSHNITQNMDEFFKDLFGFYPNKKGWRYNVPSNKKWQRNSIT